MTPEEERAVFSSCSDLWTRTFGTGMSDADALMMMRSELERGQRYHGLPPLTETEVARLVATTKWIDCGAPRLVTDAKYGAAMMCSHVSESLFDDIIIPWKAFRVDLPKGLLGHDEYTYSHILVSSFQGGEPGAMLLLEGERAARPEERVQGGIIHATRTMYADSLAEMLLDRESVDAFDVPGVEGITRPEMRDAKTRACRLAIRLVVGLLYTMQYTQDSKPAAPSLNDQRKHIRSGPPKHRTIFVGKPITLEKFDVRAAVRDFCSTGTRRAPSVQTLVRGYFRRQVVGVGRSGRKVIWVDPYWRGPEEAPILARPIKVGPSDKSNG